MDNQWDLGYVITIVTMQFIYTMHHYHHLWTIWPCTWSRWVWNVWHALLNRSMISNPLISISSPNCGVSSKGFLIWCGKSGKMALQVRRVLIHFLSQENPLTIMTIAVNLMNGAWVDLPWPSGSHSPNQTNKGWMNLGAIHLGWSKTYKSLDVFGCLLLDPRKLDVVGVDMERKLGGQTDTTMVPLWTVVFIRSHFSAPPESPQSQSCPPLASEGCHFFSMILSSRRSSFTARLFPGLFAHLGRAREVR